MRSIRSLLCVAVFLAACGGDATGPDSGFSFVGTYTLVTVNGSGLPYVALQSGQSSISIVDDRVTIADGGSWAEQGTLRVVTNGQAATQIYSTSGNWVRSGNSLSLIATGYSAPAYSGSFSSRQLNFVGGSGTTYIFAR